MKFIQIWLIKLKGDIYKMSFLNGEKKLFKIFNIVDLFIIVFVLSVILGAYTFLKTNISKSGDSQNSYTITLELERVEEFIYDAIKVDKDVYDTVQNKPFGKITDARKKEAVEYNVSTVNGKTTKTVVPGLINVEVDILVNTKEDIYVGKLIGIKNKDFTSSGYIIDMDKVTE